VGKYDEAGEFGEADFGGVGGWAEGGALKFISDGVDSDAGWDLDVVRILVRGGGICGRIFKKNINRPSIYHILSLSFLLDILFPCVLE
jgi:hypothetical protein